MNKTKLYLVNVFTAIIGISVLAQAFAADEVTLTTYYPAPYGVYNVVRCMSVGSTTPSQGRVEAVAYYGYPKNDEYFLNVSGDTTVANISRLGAIAACTYYGMESSGGVLKPHPGFFLTPNLKSRLWQLEVVDTFSANRIAMTGPIAPNWPSGKTVWASWSDIAEGVKADGCEPTDVVIIDQNNDDNFIKSNKAYDEKVAGVISEDPKLYLNAVKGAQPLALAGKVRCKVTKEGGQIKRGDVLVTSSKPGYAMKADIAKLKPGMMLGKTLEPFDGEEGKILILVTAGN